MDNLYKFYKGNIMHKFISNNIISYRILYVVFEAGDKEESFVW